VEKIKCILKNCPEYKNCNLKKDPFQGGNMCKGYQQYADQDEVKQREVAFAYMDFDINRVCDTSTPFKDIEEEKKSLIFDLYFHDKKSVNDIVLQVGCSKVYAYEIIKSVKKLAFTKKKNKKRQ
jgi:hypothetical protein